MRLSIESPIPRLMTALAPFVMFAASETCLGAESEEVLAVYSNRAVPGFFFLAALIWIGTAVFCLFKSPAGRDALRFFAGLAFLAGVLFGTLGLSLAEQVIVTETGIRFSHWELDGKHEVRVSFLEIQEVEITRPADGSHKYAPYLNYHHQWRFNHSGDSRRLWFIDTKEKEDGLISILAEHGVRVSDRRRGARTPVFR